MKTIIIQIFFLFIFSLSTNVFFGQVTNDNNNPSAGAFVGFNAGQDLDFRTNNINRMRLMQTGNVNVNQGAFANSGFLSLSTDPAYITPWSLLHLNGDNVGNGPYSNGHRNWMRYGLLFTHNRDLMYVGPKSNGTDVTDAVIGWGDNALAGLGPDVLRFLFLSGTGSGSGSDSDGGLEIGRMTGEGHTGLGIAWTNTVIPKRTLDVVRTQNVPQFRITRSTSTTETGGVHTDFETSSLGHLHILPRSSGNVRNVGIGFLSGTTPSERLDVLGNARFRIIPLETPNVLVTGVEEGDEGDYSLSYLEFSGNDDEFLAGDGTWQDATQCTWDIMGTTQPIDLAMGYTGSCNEGHAGVGVSSPDAKLDVFHSADQENPKSIAGKFKMEEHAEENFFLTNAISATLERADEVGLMARGIESYSFGAERNWAGYFMAKGTSKTKAIVGIEGRGENSNTSSVNYDVYGVDFKPMPTPQSDLVLHRAELKDLGKEVCVPRA